MSLNSAELSLSKIRDLATLGRQPNVFLSDELVKSLHPAPVRVVRLPITLGSFDNEYTPDIAVGIVQKNAFPDPVNDQEVEDSTFEQCLNHRRRVAVNHGLMSPEDRLIGLLIANNRRLNGISVASLILSQTHRGRGLARIFYRHFQETVKDLADYLYGDHSCSRYLDFFIKDGAIPTAKLHPDVFDRQSDVYLGIPSSPTHSIKFLNPDLERKCVGGT